MKLPFDEKCNTFWWNAAHTHIFSFIAACNTHNFQCIIRNEHAFNTHMPAVSIVFPREHFVLHSLSLSPEHNSQETRSKYSHVGDLCVYCFYFRFREKKRIPPKSTLNWMETMYGIKCTREKRWLARGKGDWLNWQSTLRKTRWERNAMEANERERETRSS